MLFSREVKATMFMGKDEIIMRERIKIIHLFLETWKSAVKFSVDPLHNLTQLFKSFNAKYGQCACGNIWNGLFTVLTAL